MSDLNELSGYNRIGIAGVPSSGKTFLAESIRQLDPSYELFHTDDTKHLPWDEQPHIWLERVAGVEKFVLEGVQVGRVLRKARDEGKPCPVDVVVWMSEPLQTYGLPGLARMAKGTKTIWRSYLATSPDVKVIDW